MKRRHPLGWASLAVLLAFFAASCGGDEPAVDEDSDGGEGSEAPAADDSGMSVTMGRANWQSGYLQAEIYRQLLGELGYEVSDPAEKELAPSLAYLAMAEADAGDGIDFWANSWYPLHVSWLEKELPDRSKVGDHLTVVGNEMEEAAIQGLLITKSFADVYGITHLDQINDSAEILTAFDAADAEPGNGQAEIYGCPEDWTCDDVLESQIAFSGWDNIVQLKAGYDAMFAEAEKKVEAGEPVVIYTYGPTAYLAKLRPGDNVVWIAVEDVVDDSNPRGVEGGEAHDQRPGTIAVPPELCPAAAETGLCQLGWLVNNIQVTANTQWLDANPVAAELFCAVRLPVVDIVGAALELSLLEGEPVESAVVAGAASWIEENRAEVDGWIERAENAPPTPSCPDTSQPWHADLP